ncbi:RsmB/NOP family class I SAM-dependent RNA methyltransferase [candidate division KSB1 bacterium]|nr:RsmB/NOP family class I SAM-dependent RNA methyltransferase [candidate division KSB1 bacterium]
MQIPNKDLERYLTDLIGHDALEQIGEEPVSIRANTLMTDVDAVRRRLQTWGVRFKPHPLNPDGLLIEDDFIPLSHSLLYFTGAIQYHGASSQVPVLALDPQPGETILDLAAAPGSKSTQIAAAMRNRGRLMLNDVSELRLQTLQANLNRSGVINTSVHCLPGQRLGRWLPETFDRVLLDAPCSNLGKNAGQLERMRKWKREILDHQSNLQFHLLASALKTVRIGGVLVYSTCSLAPEENEAVIDRLLQAYPHQVAVESIPLAPGGVLQPGLPRVGDTAVHTDLQKSRRIYPYPQPMESFFVARLRKLETIPVRPHHEPLQEIALESPGQTEVRAALDNLASLWGIDRAFFDAFAYHLTQKKLWLAAPERQIALKNGLVGIGLPIALRKSTGWRLTNAGVRFFRHRISERIIELDLDDLVELFEKGRIDNWGKQPAGYYVLRYNDELVGAVSHFDQVLKIRLPHSFRLAL